MLKFYFYYTLFCQCVPMETSITRLYATFQIFNIIAYSTKFFLILGVYVSNHLKLLYTIFFPNSFHYHNLQGKYRVRHFTKTYYQAVVNILQKTEASYASSSISITVNCLTSYMACLEEYSAYPNSLMR